MNKIKEHFLTYGTVYFIGVIVLLVMLLIISGNTYIPFMSDISCNMRSMNITLNNGVC